ncbi:MAG: M60 family metallopeptidase, partial [Paraclostridium sp.]
TFIMRSSDATGKDLREFFKRWGIVASPNTNKYLDSKNYPKEDKAIYYLNDEARRKRLKAIDNNNINALEMDSNVKVNASFGTDENGNQIGNKSYINKKEVPLEFSVDKDNDKILGYEIIRKEATANGTKEVVSGFVARDEANSTTKYTDVIDSVNNRTFGYKVRAYDYNLNVTDTFDIGTVKVTHDGSIAKSSFTFDTNTRGKDDVENEESGHGQVANGSINNIKDNDKNTVYNASKATDQNGNVVGGDPYVTIDMGVNKSVVGLKYTPGQSTTKKFSLKNLFSKNKEITYSPISKYEVLVSKDGKEWTKAHAGTFDTTKENIIYFNEAGNSDNSQLWTHNAKYVKLVAKGASTISIAELDLIGPPGDNIEIGLDNNDQNYKNGVGRLKADYEYAPGKTIPAGSILVMGEYRGDPAFNVPLILNENDENFALEAQTILLANLPEDSQLGEVAEGNYIYWITPEQQDKVINGENNIEGKAIKAELYRYNKLDSNNAPIGQRLVSDTFLVDLPTNLDELPIIDLNSSVARANNSHDEVIEINKDVVKKAFENRK